MAYQGQNTSRFEVFSSAGACGAPPSGGGVAALSEAMAAANMVSADDVRVLRRAVDAAGDITTADVETIVALSRAVAMADVSLTTLISDMLIDLTVHQARPEGHVDTDTAQWLAALLAPEGRAQTPSDIEILVTVIEKADLVPDWLSALALKQVADAVMRGTGAARGARPGLAGVVTGDDIALLQRILFAYGGAGAVAITRCEAEVLFDLHDATLEADNHEDWVPLFVKALANFLMSASWYDVPSREEALKQDRLLSSRIGVAGSFTIGLANELRGLLPAREDNSPAAYAFCARKGDMGAAIRAADARWLASRIGRDGRFSATEQGLLTFMRKEGPPLDPALQTLVDTAA